MNSTRLHGAALTAFAASLAVGEGVAAVTGLLLLAMTVHRRNAAQLGKLWSPVTRITGLGLMVFFGAGAFAVLVAREGFRVGEIARHTGWLAAPLVAIALSALPKRWWRRAATAFVAASVLSAAFGLAQTWMDVDLGHSMVRVDLVSVNQWRTDGHVTAGGFFFHRLKFAHTAVLALVVLLVRQVSGQLSRRRRVAELAALAVLLAALFESEARAVWLGLALAVLAGGTLKVPTRIAAIAVAGVLLAPWMITQRAPPFDATRAVVWNQAQRALDDHPWGVGLGNYRDVGERYLESVEPGLVAARTDAHSLLLQALVETGPIGAGAFAWAWLALAWCMLERARTNRAAAAPALALIAWWGIGTVHHLLFFTPVLVLVAATMGAAIAIREL